MGQVLHGSARTTEAIRRAIQHGQASLRDLARRFGINPKTVAKWKKRETVADHPTGPREPRSTVLSVEDEAIVVAFRGRPDTRSFGKPTAGLTTGVEGFRLADGAMLFLATSRFADRDGAVYDGPLPPDDLVLDRPEDAALEWLLEQPACAAAGP